MKFIGRNGNLVLFAKDNSAVIVDEISNKTQELQTLGVALSSFSWEKDQEGPSKVSEELALSSFTDLDIKVFANSDRMYTIPKSVQAEAKRALAWRKENKRGGTPVGLNTARTLAKGGQIGIKKLRHIAKYFPRHEVDKKAKGYRPGEVGYPSNGRIAWALWGGDAAQSWATSIVERENKKLKNTSSITAGHIPYGLYEEPKRQDLESFVDPKNMPDRFLPQFFIRICLGSGGIDRLYKMEPDGSVFVWDDGCWDDLGNINHDIKTYDKSLDDPYDQNPKVHAPVDPESALMISALLDSKPFEKVYLSEIDQDETDLVFDSLGDLDWELIDDAMFAASEVMTAASTPIGQGVDDGIYTPEERSAKASQQVRDSKGRFAKSGGRVIVGGDPNVRGTITNVDSISKNVSVRLDNGTDVVIPANTTEAEDLFEPRRSWVNPGPMVDTSGILGEPRTPIDEPNARLPGRLPALNAQSINTLLYDYPAWVADQRLEPEAAPTLSRKGFTPQNSDTYKNWNPLVAPNAYNNPWLRTWLDSGAQNRYWYNPMVSPGTIEAKKSAREVGPEPSINVARSTRSSSSTGSKTSTPRNFGDPQQYVKSAKERIARSRNITAAGTVEETMTPETSDVAPIYMAIVAEDDPQAVMDLVSLIPSSEKSNSPMTFTRKDGEWIKEEQILNDLNSPTPPPIVVLDNETLANVVGQVDASTQTASAWMENFYEDRMMQIVWGPKNEILSLVAAGGLDRNRGNAEKLRRYWTIGKGALKIRWNTPGDWTRCYRQLAKYMGPRAKGYCSLRHKEMTGVWPGSKYNVGKKKKSLRGSASEEESMYDELEKKVVEKAILSAKAAELKLKVLIASGESYVVEEKDGASFSIPLVIPEGIESGDGRYFEKGSIDLRELPLPLLWQIKTAEGHSGSVVVGKIVEMRRIDDGIGEAKGVFDTGEYGKEAERLVRGGFIRGVSADMDKFEASEDTEEASEDSDKKVIGAGKIKITKARVMAVTIVPKPAFQECRIILDEMVSDKEEEVVQDGVYVEGVDALDASTLVACGVVAGAIPVVPPADWFENPKLDKPTGLTVTDEGKVFGHIAAWHVDHIGMSFGTRPPKSKSNYAYFHTGLVRTDAGNDVPVGQLTLAGGHASLEASAQEAVRHYDDTASSVADVHAGEDSYGIWVAGALRPGTTPEQVRALRASAPSGDWRPIKGSLELVAVCQVNVPGFPIARARVASGQVMALVAAGASVLARLKEDPLKELSTRLEKLEESEKAPLVAAAEEAKSRITAISAALKAKEATERFSKLKIDSESMFDYMLQSFDDDEEAELSVISRKIRMRLAKEKKALPDGSFPIRNVTDLKNAIRAYGRAKPGKRGLVKKHIMRRARGLSRAELIPDKWKEAALLEYLGEVEEFTENSEAVFAEKPIEKAIDVEKLTDEERDKLKKALRAEKKSKDDSRPKYTPQTQPRDTAGKFRQVLARIKMDAGEAGLDRVLDKVQEAENLDNTGDYAGSAKAADDLIGIIDRLDTKALNPEALESIKSSSAELGKVIANLPFAFGEEAQKIRFSDIPPALRDLIEDMVERVETKIGKEDADIATKGLKKFMSGSDLYNQSEISSEMSKLLRLLT
jgi:hypothetical protein